MWMLMDSNHDHGRDQLKPPPDLAVGRKLRPLMPRPIGNHSYSTLSTPSCCCRNPKNLPWNHHISAAAAPLVSTRWNPTPEQLQALEEMYRRGIRTPSAEQIQQIAAKLGKLGKIEGKNVFYWFQNHKARERQRKRRQLELLAAGKKMPLPHAKHTGLSTRYVDMEHRKTAPIPSNCSTSSADSASMHVAVISGKEGWPEMQHKNENCWQLDSSSSIKSITTSHQNTGQENTHSCENEEDQTLQLFPAGDRRREISVDSLGAKITPIQFIEFLPIKN